MRKRCAYQRRSHRALWYLVCDAKGVLLVEFGGCLGLGVWTGDLLVVGCDKLVHFVSVLKKRGEKREDIWLPV